MLTGIVDKVKSNWIVALSICVIASGSSSAVAECQNWPNGRRQIESLSGYWEVQYDLNGSEFETRNTPLRLADTTHVVGPGTMTIRFESDGSGPGGGILDGGEAQIVQLDLTQQFAVRTRVMGFSTEVMTRLNSAIPDNRWDGNAAGRVALGSGLGTIHGETLSVDAPGMRSYHTLGSVLCNGHGCRFGSLPRGKHRRIDNDSDVIPLRTLHFGAGGPQQGAGFESNQIALPLDEHAEPYLRLIGREIHRVYVPATTETAMTARPCYSVLGFGAQSAEAFTGGE